MFTTLSKSIGLISLIIVISLWLISSILTKDILKEYNKPALMTFISVTSMQIYFVFLKFKDPLFEYLKMKTFQKDEEEEDEDNENKNDFDQVSISLKETAKISFNLFLLYFIGLYFMNSSLKFTTLGSSSIINATCSFFTFLLGISLKIESFTLEKGFAVLLTFIGVLVNSLPDALNDSMNFGTQTWGNVLALLDSIFYAFFLVLLQKQTKQKIGLNRSILLAFMGFFTMISCWPILVYLTLSRHEIFEMPPNNSVLFYLIIKIVLGSVIPSYLWNVAFALTSPLYISVGTSLTVPLNFMADYFLGNKISLSGAIGAVIVTLGCLLLTFTDNKQDEKD